MDYTFNNTNVNNIDDLINIIKPYMLIDIEHYNINNNIINNSILKLNNNDTNLDEKKMYSEYKVKAPYFERNPDYNKERRKYNEKIITNNLHKHYDKLFWCFYKIYKNLEENDLLYINTFTEEKNNKIKFVEELESKKNILKKFKIKHSILKDELLNENKISLYTFKNLFILYNLNVIILKDNNTFSGFFSNEDYNKLFLNNIPFNDLESEFKLNNIIKLNYSNTSYLANNYDIIMDIKISNENIIKLMETSYYIENLEKPLKSESSYKLQELIDIANKLKINLLDNTKKKTKKILYSEILKILS